MDWLFWIILIGLALVSFLYAIVRLGSLSDSKKENIISRIIDKIFNK